MYELVIFGSMVLPAMILTKWLVIDTIIIYINNKNKTMKIHKAIKTGLTLLAIGTGPLLITASLDYLGAIDGGNFLLFGMLAWLTFYPALITIAYGVTRTLVTHFKTK